jgi:methionine synthase II (cobalamin-independent)
MLRSTDRIRTTHVGSLARPPELLDMMRAEALTEGARLATARLW